VGETPSPPDRRILLSERERLWSFWVGLCLFIAGMVGWHVFAFAGERLGRLYEIACAFGVVLLLRGLLGYDEDD
jgi:hypothetical protein